MASESTDEGTVTVSLPAELDDWLDEQAAEMDVDRETVLVQLLSSYRASAELGGELENGQLPVSDEAIDEAVDDALDDRLDDELDERVQATVQTAIDSVVTDRLSEATNTVQQQLDDRLEDVEDDYMDKIQDVRERVVQLKHELDGKAAADHTHEELDRVNSLAVQLEDIQETVDSIEQDVENSLTEQEVVVEELEERMDTVQDRLKTVAWVVSDLREAQESMSGMEAVDRIKRAAAKSDVERANCENCGEGVQIGLLTEPQCPHCEATVTNVEAASGFFGKPRLLTASQLESGEEE